eukprot:4921551-Pleurochrysis_carterae.AAC.1
MRREHRSHLRTNQLREHAPVLHALHAHASEHQMRRSVSVAATQPPCMLTHTSRTHGMKCSTIDMHSCLLYVLLQLQAY